MKTIDTNQIIEEVFERSGISSTPNHVRKAIKDIARLTAEQALDMAEERVQDLFAENASENGRMITPTLVGKEIMNLIGNVK